MIDLSKLQVLYKAATAAEEYMPVSPGDYTCSVSAESKLWTASTKTAAFKITFVIEDESFKGRKLHYDCWLTEAAIGQTKRDLSKIGVEDITQLDKPLNVPGKFLVSVESYEDGGRERTRAYKFVPVQSVPVQSV